MSSFILWYAALPIVFAGLDFLGSTRVACGIDCTSSISVRTSLYHDPLLCHQERLKPQTRWEGWHSAFWKRTWCATITPHQDPSIVYIFTMPLDTSRLYKSPCRHYIQANLPTCSNHTTLAMLTCAILIKLRNSQLLVTASPAGTVSYWSSLPATQIITGAPSQELFWGYTG